MKQNRQQKPTGKSLKQEGSRKPAHGSASNHGSRVSHKSSRPDAAVSVRSSQPASSRDRIKPKERFSSRDRMALPEGVFMVEGVAAIREYLKFKPSSILKIFVKERALKSVREELGQVTANLTSVPDANEENLPHTPAWAHVKHDHVEWSTFLSRLENFSENSDKLVLVLDHISDPRNLGAIVRTAAFFGVKHVIVPDKRQVLLTQSGVNTAQGGFALTDLVLVVNVSRAIEELKTKNYWVLGAAMNGEPVSKIKGRYDRQVLVLGSEDKGISQHVLGRCDVTVAITGSKNTLESLNVSVAAGILIHDLSSV